MQDRIRTYLPAEQELAESEISEVIDYIRSVCGVLLLPAQVKQIALSSNVVAAHNIFRMIADSKDIFVESDTIYAMIISIVCAYNDYATLLAVGNCVGDNLAQMAYYASLPAEDIWPTNEIGEYQDSLSIYLDAEYEFRQSVRDLAHRKLSYTTDMGAYITLSGAEFDAGKSNVELTPAELILSWAENLTYVSNSNPV